MSMLNDRIVFRRGETLVEIFHLLDDRMNATCPSPGDSCCCCCLRLNQSSFYHIEASLDSGSPAQSRDDSMDRNQEDVVSSQIDIPSCVYFMIDLFTQWLQNPVSFHFPLSSSSGVNRARTRLALKQLETAWNSLKQLETWIKQSSPSPRCEWNGFDWVKMDFVGWCRTRPTLYWWRYSDR